MAVEQNDEFHIRDANSYKSIKSPLSRDIRPAMENVCAYNRARAAVKALESDLGDCPGNMSIKSWPYKFRQRFSLFETLSIAEE